MDIRSLMQKRNLSYYLLVNVEFKYIKDQISAKKKKKALYIMFYFNLALRSNNYALKLLPKVLN